MKKSLVALAALAVVGAASAQSTVTLSGTLDPAFRHVTTTQNGAETTVNGLKNNAQGTTAIIFKGVEDLGSGLKASFLYEADFDATLGSATVNPLGGLGGEIYAGIAGGFGSLKLGAPNTPSLTVQGNRQPFGTKIGGGFGGVTGSGHVRENGSIVYATPSFSGFSGAFGWTSATAPAYLGAAKSDLGLFYVNGPLNAGLSYYKQDNVNKQINLSASYAFGPATVYAGLHTEDKIDVAGATSSSDGANIAVKYAVTPAINLLANYGRLNDKSTPDADKNIATVGAQYLFSKRTSVYARYVRENNDNATVAAPITQVNTTLVGLMHTF